MNEVLLEGVITASAKVGQPIAGASHLRYQLRVSHRSRQGLLKHELYTVNVWNQLAQWAEKYIQPDMPVLVKGYLTQRTTGGIAVTEVTASRFIIRQVKTSAATALPAPSNE